MGKVLALVAALCWVVTLSYSKEPVENIDCYTGDGSDYRGTVAKSKTGQRCHYWNHVTAKTGKYKDRSIYSENYCRSIGIPNMLMCFVPGNPPLSVCDVPKCPKCYDGSDIIFQYEGKMNVTKSGKTCQRWDANTPHNHTGEFGSKPEHFPENNVTAAENYCRVMGGQSIHAWCYTTDPKTRIEHCPFPVCKGYEKCYFREVSTYKGNVSKTKTGDRCLRWDSPQVKKKCKMCGLANSFPDASVSAASNYCRQPVARHDTLGYVPWCFTANGWGYCDIPPCPDKCSKILKHTYISTIRSQNIKATSTDTQDKCISLCQKTAGCYRWSYVTTKFHVKKYRKKCYLYKGARYHKPYMAGINSGSRFMCGVDLLG